MDPRSPGHVNASGIARARDAFCRRRPGERSFEARRGAPLLAGRRGRLPRGFIDVRRHRLDLSPQRFRVGREGRVRSPGFCRCLFPRARPRTARAPRPPNLRAGRLPWSDRVASIEGNHRIWLEVRGRGDRSSTFPAAIARHGDFAPTSTVSGASCRGHRPLALSGVTRAEGDAAIASRACKARERQGRATPGFREEARRSPTRGTFHHWAVRERTEAQAVQTSCQAAGRRLFHRRDFRAGDARAESDGSANRSGRPANRARTD